MRRVVVPERLDVDAGTEQEVRASLADLQRINILFGGVSSTTAMIRTVARATGAKNLSLLEVASGTGFVPVAAKRRMAREGVTLHVNLLDRSRSHLPAIGIPAHVGDALALPFADNSFDVISCGLFLHHLDPQQVGTFARESLRVARRAVLISDLVRSPVHLALTHLGLLLFRSPITWHDAPASVRAAYTPEEVSTMFARSAARRVEIRRYYLYRMGVILWK